MDLEYLTPLNCCMYLHPGYLEFACACLCGDLLRLEHLRWIHSLRPIPLTHLLHYFRQAPYCGDIFQVFIDLS